MWTGKNLDNFTPFKDPNPDCRPDELYKAVAAGPGGLYALRSADGIHWSYLAERPIITKGAFDTQNNAFWDAVRKHYWCYIRDFHNGIRDIRVSTSPDFHTWTEPRMLVFVDSPDEALYTNQVRPYERAPQIFLGFPTRYVERKWFPAMKELPDPVHRERRMKFHPRFGTAVTDCLFMSSRDGRTFHRFNEAFLRPGAERKDNWVYGDCYPSLGLLQMQPEDPTSAPEWWFYVGENHWKGPIRLRRYTIRLDGFASVHASQEAGFLVTKPLIFRGKELTLNFSTSAAGSAHVELQDAQGKGIPGFEMHDSDELFGDAIERRVTWHNRSDVSGLAGRPIRIRFTLSDGDIYSFRFRE